MIEPGRIDLWRFLVPCRVPMDMKTVTAAKMFGNTAAGEHADRAALKAVCQVLRTAFRLD